MIRQLVLTGGCGRGRGGMFDEGLRLSRVSPELRDDMSRPASRNPRPNA